MTSSEVTTWQPASLLSPTHQPTTPFAIIILNQPLQLRSSIYSTLFANATYKIAADGGANRLYDLAMTSSPSVSLDLIIGDLDSLLPHVKVYWERQGVKVVKDGDQYSTDFGKAFNWIKERQKEEKKEGEKEEELDIVVLGGLGGRIDQGLSVLHHIYMFQSSPRYADGKMFLLSSEAITFLLKSGKHKIKAKERFGIAGEKEGETVSFGLGKHVGIIPVKEASVITTSGLEWDVEDWKTEFGGNMSTSNHVKEEWVEVETTKDVIFTIDLQIDVEMSR